MSRLRDLTLVTELRAGHHDMCMMDYVGPHLIIYDKRHRVAIRINDLPEWAHRQSREQVPHFLQAFAKLHTQALLYLLEDSKPLEAHESPTECTYTHLSQLTDFLKETN